MSRNGKGTYTHDGFHPEQAPVNAVANHLDVDPASMTAVNAMAASMVQREIRQQVRLSVAADRRIIADAADKAVRAALASFGINA